MLRVGFNQVANQSITQSIDQLSTQSMNESIIQIKSLAARNRCSGVPRSHLALEITARARFFVFGNTRKRRPSVSARSRGSSKRRWIRQHFRVSCGIPFEIPFEIALLRTLHCFELCFARLHRHRQVPYANLVYIYNIYTHNIHIHTNKLEQIVRRLADSVFIFGFLQAVRSSHLSSS